MRLFMRILLVNDDGIDSPALIPTINALEKVGDVEIVVPRYEQSWTSKSNTRRADKMKLEIIERGGREILTLEGSPADCGNYGIFKDSIKPDLVVSGMNVGHNVGIAAFLASGTVGAAMEGVLAGIPSIAVSGPYYQDSKLIDSEFVPPLEIFPKIITHYMENSLEDLALLHVNLPIGKKHEKVVATNVGTHSFGTMFDTKGDGYAYPVFYPKLIQPDGKEFLSDCWAKENGYGSVTGFTHLIQMIDRKITHEWLSLADLAYNEEELR